MREKSGKEICEDVFGVKAQWIIDPVFMVNPKIWNDLADKGNIDAEGKIVSHVFDENRNHYKMYKYLKAKHNKNIIRFSDYKHSPYDWLKAIRDCDIFITNSFHGVCFAIIFKKPFICFSKETGKSTRFDSLFEKLGIEDNSVKVDDIYHKDCIFKIDYEKVEKRIKIEQQQGLEFINKTIKEDVENTQEKETAKQKLIKCVEKENSEKKAIDLWEWWIFILINFFPEFLRVTILFVWKRIKRLYVRNK